jgi:hypothetical protein
MICEGSGERYLVSGVPAGIGLVDGLGLVGQRDMLEKGSGVLYRAYRAYMPV